MANKVQYMQVLPGRDADSVVQTFNKIGYEMANVGVFFDNIEDIKFAFGVVPGKYYKVTFEEVEVEGDGDAKH